MKLLELIQREITQHGDYTSIGVKCYICEKLGHIATDCTRFTEIRGTLRHLLRQKSFKISEKRGSSTKLDLRKFGSIRFKEDFYDLEFNGKSPSKLKTPDSIRITNESFNNKSSPLTDQDFLSNFLYE